MAYEIQTIKTYTLELEEIATTLTAAKNNKEQIIRIKEVVKDEAVI